MQLEKKFNNKPNSHVKVYHKSSNGKFECDYWISRSIAVVGVIFAHHKNQVKVLITQRSERMVDEPYKFGVPCGYLDWEETIYFAMMREVYEETSFFMPDFEKLLLFNNDKQPFLIKDDPKKDKRQNVSFVYLSSYDFRNENEEKFPYDVEAFRNKETNLVKWMSINDFFLSYKNYGWAFNHDETIKSAWQYYEDNFNAIII
jgi:ADP-ribose pyrophosphatase YjhB (NUDIX family)